MNARQSSSRVSRFRPEGPVVMRPKWNNLLFLHWEMAPELIAPMLPVGLELDLFAGRAYVGLVPFQMANVCPRFVPDLGRFSHFYTRFPELNVRTYVVRDGVPGVWFFSLDAASSLAVVFARMWFKLPYFKARMRMRQTQDGFDFWSKRLWPFPSRASCRVRFEPKGEALPARPGSLDEFLVERYVLYSKRGEQLFRGRVGTSRIWCKAPTFRFCAKRICARRALPSPSPSRTFCIRPAWMLKCGNWKNVELL